MGNRRIFSISRSVIYCRFLIGFLTAGACSLALQKASGVTLAWDPNSEPDIAGYILHYGITSGHYATSVNVGNVTTNTVTSLTANVNYFFAVTAYNTAGLESDFSNEISYMADTVVPTVTITSPLANARNAIQMCAFSITRGIAPTPLRLLVLFLLRKSKS